VKSLEEDTGSSGSSEITRRGTFMFMTAKAGSSDGSIFEAMRGIEGWKPSRKLVKIIEELRSEGRL
jgi:hypothetical protein